MSNSTIGISSSNNVTTAFIYLDVFCGRDFTFGIVATTVYFIVEKFEILHYVHLSFELVTTFHGKIKQGSSI